MAIVYCVRPDVDNYQYVLTDDIGDIMQFDFDGTEVGSAWTGVSTYLGNPKKPKPDFWGCFSANKIFAVSQKASRAVVNFLDQSCETFPLEVDGNKLLLCNVTYVLSALDKANSVHPPGLPHCIERYVFHRKRLGYSLFKIPETAMSEVLCVEGIVDPADEFKGTVERLGLKGLRFIELWNDN